MRVKMRRVLKSQKAVILTVLIAIFTLMSFIFDQLVVNRENIIRELDEKYYNLNQESRELARDGNKLLISSYDLQNILLETTNQFQVSFKVLNYFYNIENVSKVHSNLDPKIMQKAEIDYYSTMMENSFRIHEFKFLDYQIRLKKFFEKKNNLSETMKKLFSDYVDRMKLIKIDLDEYKKDKFIKSQNLEKIYMAVPKIDYYILSLSNIIFSEGKKLVDEASKKFFEAEKIGGDIELQQILQNTFILCAIFFQIMSLLFLLILFKFLIKIRILGE